MSREVSRGNVSKNKTSRSKSPKGSSQNLVKKPTSLFDLTTGPQIWLIRFITGLVFGFSVSIGLGMTIPASAAFGAVVGLGIVLSGSFVAYILIQTIALSALAIVSQVVFRLQPSFSVEPAVFQVGYLVFIAVAPFVALIPKIRLAVNSFEVPEWAQIMAVLFFAFLVQFLRSRMPSDSAWALKSLYLGEDNAGVVAVVAESLERGYASHVSQFGEFINGAYLAAGGTIEWFGGQESLGLLSALTHYNMTLLFMAWAPIASLMALSYSGSKFKNFGIIAVITASSATLSLLFWPSTLLGHTSIISSGLTAMSIVALALNRKLALEHPVLFALTMTSLAYIAGTTWFPFLPFSAGAVALTFAALLQVQFQKGHKKIVLGLVTTFLLLSTLFIPQVLSRLLQSGDYLQHGGGTRNPGLILPIIWFVLLIATSWKLLRGIERKSLLGAPMFLAVLGLLGASNLYVLLAGLLQNGGSFGYGATKYFLTSITFTLPIMFMVLAESVKSLKMLSAAGLAIIVAILVTVPFTRMVPAAFAAPTITPFLASPTAADIQAANSGVLLALQQAVTLKPDHIFCASDFGFPAPNEEESMESYMCTRWGGALIGNESGYAWKFVPLNRAPIGTLLGTKDAVQGQSVVLIRIVNQIEGNTSIPDKAATWWGKYADKTWDIITVRQ